MEKEELLQKARKENQHGDERITYLDERPVHGAVVLL